jgi:hypothetical protein
MKKFIVFLVILFAISAAGFSQTSANPWKFSGFLYSTLGYDIDQQYWGGSDVMIDGASMNFLYYARVSGDYDRGDMGAALSVMAISGYDTSTTMRAPLPSVYQAYGWGKFFEKKLEVKMGYVRDTTYNSGGKISTDGGEGVGIMLKYAPITGLSIGGGFYAPRLPSKTETDRNSHLTVTVPNTGGTVQIPLYPATLTPGFSTTGTGPVEKATVSWGVAYEMAKVFKISYAGGWRDNALVLMTSGIHLLAVPNLTASFEVFTSNIRYKEPEAGYPYIAFDETLAYRIDQKLTFGVSAYQFFNNTNIILSRGGPGAFYNAAYDRVDIINVPVMGDVEIHSVNTYDVGLAFDPYVSYQINMFTPRLGLSIESYGNRSKSKSILVSSGMVMSDTDTETKRFIFGLKPQIGLRMGMSASLDLAYAMTMTIDTVNEVKADPVFDNKLTAMFVLIF